MLLDANKYPVAKEKHPVWSKVPAILEAMNSHPSAEWIWWLDMDALIMNPRLDLFDYLLNPDVLQRRLLTGHQVVPNNRIQLGKSPLPDLETGEVSPSLPI
jgi:galactosyl transferase GMA12/MNN10 family